MEGGSWTKNWVRGEESLTPSGVTRRSTNHEPIETYCSGAMTGASQPTLSAPDVHGFGETPRAISSEPEALCSQGDRLRYWGGLAG